MVKTAALYNRYADFIKKKYQFRVQKITVDMGFTCPNRDGSVAFGGCTYCNNLSFSPPAHVAKMKLRDQIDHGIEFSKRKYKSAKKYLVYFQPYSNTYAPLSKLAALYEEALDHPDVMGLCIGTRPDCVDHEKISYLENLAKDFDITLEYGLESISDETLKKINRGHDFRRYLDALDMTMGRGIDVCTHIIIGFPWENQSHWIQTAQTLSTLPTDFLKIHQLHVVDKTKMAQDYRLNPFKILDKNEYMEALREFLEHLDPRVVIQRLYGEAPRQMLLSPSWEIRSSDFFEEFTSFLESRNSFQGKRFTQAE